MGLNQFNVSLWGDEAWAATLAIKPIPQLMETIARDTSPPLYYLSYHAWISLFGISEISIRALSFTYFFLTAIAVYFIAKKLFSKKAGFLAAAFTFLNPFLLNYGFEGRMYAILAFTSTLSMCFFVYRRKTLYILASLAALYTHHFSLFIIGFQFFWVVGEYFRKQRLHSKKIKFLWSKFKVFFFIGLGYLPWLPSMYYQTKMVSEGFWLGKPLLKHLPELYAKFLVGTQGNFANIRYITDFRHTEFLSASILILLVLILLLRRWQFKKSADWLMIIWLTFPVLITWGLSQVVQPIFYDRYLLNCIPPLMILLGSRFRKISLPFIIIAICLLSITNYQFFTNPQKPPFRDLANFVKETRQQGDQLINGGGAAHHLFESKYYGIPAPIYTPEGPLPFYTGTALMEPEDQIETLPDAPRLGIITSDNLDKFLELPDYQLESQHQFGKFQFLWLRKN